MPDLASRLELKLKTTLTELASAGKIETPEQEARSISVLEILDQLIEECHAEFDPPVKAAEASLKSSREHRDKYLIPLSKARTDIRAALEIYRSRLKEKEKVIQADSAEALRKELEYLDMIGGAAPMGIAHQPPAAEKDQRIGTRSNYIGTVTDLRALAQAWLEGKVPDGIITFSQKEVNKLAQRAKQTLNILGVAVIEKGTIYRRRKK